MRRETYFCMPPQINYPPVSLSPFPSLSSSLLPLPLVWSPHLQLRQDLAALLLVQGHPVLAAQQQPPRGAAEVHPVRVGVRRRTLLRHFVREVLDQDLSQSKSHNVNHT